MEHACTRAPGLSTRSNRVSLRVKACGAPEPGAGIVRTPDNCDAGTAGVTGDNVCEILTDRVRAANSLATLRGGTVSVTGNPGRLRTLPRCRTGIRNSEYRVCC